MYNLENYSSLKKKGTLYMCLSIFMVFVAVGVYILFYFLSNRDNKLTMEVFGFLGFGLSISAVILFASMSLDYKRKSNQFFQILSDKGLEIVGEFIKQETIERTLIDNTTVKELSFKVDGGERRFYLSTLFTYDFKENKTYKLVVVSDFIKEIKDEQ